jgi:hypothetical protein
MPGLGPRGHVILRPVYPPAPACRHCGNPAIAGEGADVCLACVLRYGVIAEHPERLTQGEGRLLLETSGDVVRLVQCFCGRLEWRWKGWLE